MTFISIAIFTVYTTHTIYVGKCDPEWSRYNDAGQMTMCADYMSSEPQETGRSEPRYIGEFQTIEACRAAAGAAKYKPKEKERVGDITQILCVPKDATANPETKP